MIGTSMILYASLTITVKNMTQEINVPVMPNRNGVRPVMMVIHDITSPGFTLSVGNDAGNPINYVDNMRIPGNNYQYPGVQVYTPNSNVSYFPVGKPVYVKFYGAEGVATIDFFGYDAGKP